VSCRAGIRLRWAHEEIGMIAAGMPPSTQAIIAAGDQDLLLAHGKRGLIRTFGADAG
jgi:hypothetical protein